MSRRTAHLSAVTLSALVLAGLGTTGAHAAVVAPSVTPTPAAPAAQADPISFVASTSKAANVQVAKVVVPAGVQVGDTLLLTGSLGNTTSVTGPKGWTLVGDQSVPALRGMVWTRTAVAGDAGSTVSVALDAIHKSVLTVTAYRGVDATAPVAVTSSVDASTATHVTPDTRTAVGSKVVSFWAERGNATTAWKVPVPAVRSSAFSTGSGRVSAAVADAAVSPTVARSATPAGSATATTDALSARGVNWSIVLLRAQHGADREHAADLHRRHLLGRRLGLDRCRRHRRDVRLGLRRRRHLDRSHRLAHLRPGRRLHDHSHRDRRRRGHLEHLGPGRRRPRHGVRHERLARHLVHQRRA